MSNVFRQDGKVPYGEKCRLMGQRGLAVWFTGLSGSGKSTIAAETERLLHGLGIKTCLLDGDNMRMGLCSDLGFSDADRDENVRRVSEVARLFCDAGIVALVALISPFAEARKKARLLVGDGRFIEVYVEASLETCRDRDPKGLYAKGIGSFTGVDSAYEPPMGQEISINTETLSIEESALLVVDAIMEKVLLMENITQ